MKQEEKKDFEEIKESKDSNKKGKGKGRGRRKPKSCNSKAKGNVNDTGFYYTDPNVLASVTNFSFTEFQGVPINFPNQLSTATNENVANVITIRVNPSVQPTATEGNTGYEAINVVGLRNYTNLTAGNGKTSNYGPADPTMAVLAIGSAVCMYSHLKRAFNTYQLVNQRNRDYPKLLFKAMGIDWDDFKANIANYRDQFNLLVCQFDKIPMFDSITYLTKCKQMFEYIYVDEDSPLAQTYLFVPNSVWTLDEAYDAAGSGLVTTALYDGPYSGNAKSMQTLLDIFSVQISRLTTSSTLNLVYSDILRLMQNGRGKAFLLETIPLMPDPKFAPVINDEVRHWINNMVLMGNPVAKDYLPAAVTHGGTNENDVACDGNTGCILYHPTFVLAEGTGDGINSAAMYFNGLYESNLVNFDSMSPTIDDKVAALRMAVRANANLTVDGNNKFVYSNNADIGDFYATAMLIWANTDTLISATTTNVLWFDATNEVTVCKGFAVRCDAFSKLKYAPRLQLVDVRATGATNGLISTMGDLTYYTMIPHSLTSRIKDAEMFGLFDFRLN